MAGLGPGTGRGHPYRAPHRHRGLVRRTGRRGHRAAGRRAAAGPAEWLLTVGLLLLYVLALSWLAAGLGALASSVESASALSFAMLFLPYLSSAFVPTDSMPAVLRAVAEHQPITPVIETVRGLLTGAPVGNSGAIATAWCTGLLALAAGGATAAFRRRTDR